MRRIKVGPATPDRKSIDAEIARLRDLDVAALRAALADGIQVFRRRAPPHLPGHLLFRVLAYRLQADHLGDLDCESQRLLDRSGSPEKAAARAAEGRRLALLLHAKRKEIANTVRAATRVRSIGSVDRILSRFREELDQHAKAATSLR